MSQGSGSGPRKGGFEGILGGLGDLLSALGDLAEKGEELKKSGVLDQAADGKDVKVHYGFSIRTAGQGGVEVEPFGNVRRTKRDDGTIETVVDETREPLVDVLEEDDHLLVVAEMPGVDAGDVQVRIEGDVLELAAETAGKRYGKELVLPREPRDPKVTTSARNGVVEIRIEDAASGAGANDEQLDDAA